MEMQYNKFVVQAKLRNFYSTEFLITLMAFLWHCGILWHCAYCGILWHFWLMLFNTLFEITAVTQRRSLEEGGGLLALL